MRSLPPSLPPLIESNRIASQNEYLYRFFSLHSALYNIIYCKKQTAVHYHHTHHHNLARNHLYRARERAHG